MRIGYINGMATNLAYIERALRNGKTPEELGGKECGKGVCKAAYKFNCFAAPLVIKLNAQDGWNGAAQKNPPKWIREYGARGPRTYKAGKYIIQEYVTPAKEVDDWSGTPAYDTFRALSKDKRNRDIHMGNVGIDTNGQLVVFDW